MKGTALATCATLTVPLVLFAGFSGAGAQTTADGLTPLGVYDSTAAANGTVAVFTTAGTSVE